MAKKPSSTAKKPPSKAKKPYNFDRILSEDEEDFCRWFWTGTNGNGLIDALNSNNTESDGSTIRRQHEGWSHIYCLVHNDAAVPGKGTHGENRVQWKYCKVGMTQADTTTGSGNRMETVQKEIERKTGKKPPILFVLRAKATDSRKDIDIEKSVREKFGWPVHKDLARRTGLPFITEWVMTTQDHIDEIRRAIAAATQQRHAPDTGLVPRFNKQDENIRLRGLEIQEGKVVGEPPVVYGPPT